MATAAERVAELGLEMTVVQDFVMAQVYAGNAAALLQQCEMFGVTAAMLGEIATWPGTPAPEALVHEWFNHWGLDSSSIATEVTVESVSSATITEGSSVSFTVHLSGDTVLTTGFAIDVGGSASLSDFASYSFSDGVTLTPALQLAVPAGVNAFTVTMVTADDTEIEGSETFELTVGGATGMAMINDNDSQQPPNGIALMPEELEGMLPIVQLNGAVGDLSTASLRAEIIAGSNESAYWSLFQVDGYVGADDGIFTNAETGWTIGDQQASAQTMESVFYGTLINALQAVDFGEHYNIGTYVFNHQAELDNGDEAAFAGLISLLVNAFIDPAGDQRALDDNTIHDAIVEVGIELVAMAQHEPSIFHGLLNWV